MDYLAAYISIERSMIDTSKHSIKFTKKICCVFMNRHQNPQKSTYIGRKSRKLTTLLTFQNVEFMKDATDSCFKMNSRRKQLLHNFFLSSHIPWS